MLRPLKLKSEIHPFVKNSHEVNGSAIDSVDHYMFPHKPGKVVSGNIVTPMAGQGVFDNITHGVV